MCLIVFKSFIGENLEGKYILRYSPVVARFLNLVIAVDIWDQMYLCCRGCHGHSRMCLASLAFTTLLLDSSR